MVLIAISHFSDYVVASVTMFTILHYADLSINKIYILLSHFNLAMQFELLYTPTADHKYPMQGLRNHDQAQTLYTAYSRGNVHRSTCAIISNTKVEMFQVPP